MGDSALVSNYTHTLDAKNRVFFPAKFREELGSPIVITVNLDGCLSAYSVTEWGNFMDKLKSLPKSQVNDITRFFSGNALKVAPDGQGRVMLNRDLIDFAEITGSITFVGCVDRVEMWAEEKRPMKSFDASFIAGLRDKMQELGI